MNLDKIKTIINSGLPKELKEEAILSIIADDEEAIPTILQFLHEERRVKKELILDTNAELSRALVVLRDGNLKYTKKIISEPKWVADEIIKHYQKWKNHIKCNFKVEGLP